MTFIFYILLAILACCGIFDFLEAIPATTIFAIAVIVYLHSINKKIDKKKEELKNPYDCH